LNGQNKKKLVDLPVGAPVLTGPVVPVTKKFSPEQREKVGKPGRLGIP